MFNITWAGKKIDKLLESGNNLEKHRRLFCI